MRRLNYSDYDLASEKPKVRVKLLLSPGIVAVLREYSDSPRISRMAEQAIRIGLGEIPPRRSKK